MRHLPLALLVFLAGTARAADPVNPHGSTERCVSCHESGAEGAPPESIAFVLGDANESCKSCHEDDPHQIGLVPKTEQVPRFMLLLDGKVACFSCHDEPACDGRTVDTEKDPYFFRGGPYPTVGGLCARCHTVTGTERFNPHERMSLEDTSSCEHCHLEVPTAGATEADLKVDGPNICLGCHQEEPHAGGQVHLGPIPEPMVASVEASGLPITKRHEIVCITCHDPHPGHVLDRPGEESVVVGAELFPPRWLSTVLQPALTARGNFEAKHVEPDFLRRPVASGALCQSCHSPAATEALRESRR